MALVLKAGETYTDPRDTSQNISAPYAVIDQNNGNKKEKKQYFVLEIYSRACSSSERNSGVVSPVQQFPYAVVGSEYDSYFSPAAIEADKDHYNRAYDYLLNLEYKDDDGLPTGVKVWRDWESDETP